ncbi:MAG: gliding motility-associated C-terminal domain-containing protein [Bacteroidales bacterium]|nr:gliding motility-associated C-terminal domain-containing protein [Bacteroidales bacterium]
MNRLIIVVAICLSLLAQVSARTPDSLSVGQLEFVPNHGQFDDQVLFQAKLRYGSLFAESNGYTVAMVSPAQYDAMHEAKVHGRPFKTEVDASAYKVTFLNSNSNPRVEGVFPYDHYYNYFTSRNPKNWASNVYPYREIIYHGLYDNVDARLYEQGGCFKYEFYVAPNTSPSIISLRYDGVKSISLKDGNLIIHNHLSHILELSPVAYQILNSDTVYVPCHYVLKGNTLSFALGAYQTSVPLVIDPTVVFSSFSGSTADNWGYTATYDSDDHLYGGGIVFGVGYPVTIGAYQVDFCGESGSVDVGITKFSVTGSNLFYSTYLGGSYLDIPHSLHVNDLDELYILGTTGSPDFPTTPTAFDTSFNGGPTVTLSTSLRFNLGADIFVAKLSTDGTQLLASTFVGGNASDGLNTAPILRVNYADDNRGEILVDQNSDVYVVSSTRSEDFPVTPGTFGQTLTGQQDVCVFKMNQNLTQMVWSTFLGGSVNDAGYSMSLCTDHTLYVTGGTHSNNFPVTANAYQSSHLGEGDGFVAHLSDDGSQLLHSTYLGTASYDQSYLIKTDKYNNPYVYGQTDAGGNSWIYNAGYFTSGGGQFLTKMNPALDGRQWSTAFGSGNGGPDISPTALSVDYCDHVYMSGWGSAELNGFGGTNGLPITPDAFQATTDSSDYYFICLDNNASSLVYASFFGGGNTQEHVDGGTSRFNRKGCIYQAVCAGCGGYSTFPTTPGAWSQTNNSTNCNLGVIKLDFAMPVVVADFTMPHALCGPDSIHFVNHSQTIGNNTTYFWDFGDGTTSNQPTPSHYYNQTGNYTITLIVQDNSSCNLADTLTRTLFVLSNGSDDLPPVTTCEGESQQIGLPPANDVSYQWVITEAMSDPSISNPIVNPDNSMLYMLVAQLDGCADTLYQWVYVNDFDISYNDLNVCCEDSSVMLHVEYDHQQSITVDWSDLPDFTHILAQNSDSLLVAPVQTTTYYVRLSDGDCEVIRPMTVIISSITLSEDPDFVICFEDGISLGLSIEGSDSYTYHWQFEDGTHSFDPHPYVSPQHSMGYSIMVTNQYGCHKQFSGEIVRREGTFEFPLDAWCDPCSVWAGTPAAIFSTDYGDSYTYQWTPEQGLTTPDSSATVVNVMHTTTFTVHVTDTFGCDKDDTVTIVVEHVTCDDPYVFVPNLFTPNGDGINDILYVRSEILDEFYFAVYSRWGEKVFETTSQQEGWDGYYKGKQCQNGVYDYYLKGSCLDGQELLMKGNVTLSR